MPCPIDVSPRVQKYSAEEKYRDDHHGGSRLHFFQRRSGNLLHLRAHVVVEGLDLLRPGLTRAPKLSPTVAIDFAIFFVSTPITTPDPFQRSQNSGRGGGFEPPSPVLETGRLTVELTPLNSFVSPDDLRITFIREI